MGIAGILPIAGENIDAAAAVARASRATAEAGSNMVDVANHVGVDRHPRPHLDGRRPRGHRSVRGSASRHAGRSRTGSGRPCRALEEAGGDGLLGLVASGYRDALEGLLRVPDLATRFRDSLRLATAMFGGQHRYLVCVPALGVPRPGGGAPATVGVLVADEGTLELESTAPASKELTDADASIDFAADGASADGSRRSRRAGSTTLDGVILIDAVALEDLVWAIGDVDDW